MKTQFNQYNETDPLKKVIIGRVDGYRAEEAYVEIVNEEQKSGLPEEEQLEREFSQFKETLENEGIEVMIPDYVGKFVYDQLTPRDIGVTIGHKFLICPVVKASRRYEVAGIFRHILAMGGDEPTILLPPDPEILLEGGDIIVDKNCIFVGISQRSNEAGVTYLTHQFRDKFTVVPVQCRRLEEGENVLHLDCTFNPVGQKMALIYVDGFEDIPDEIQQYEWIEIDKEEQKHLATNVLSLDQKTVISRNHPACVRVNEEMRKRGLQVIELPFDAAPSTGGSFRCCSLPLVREVIG